MSDRPQESPPQAARPFKPEDVPGYSMAKVILSDAVPSSCYAPVLEKREKKGS